MSENIIHVSDDSFEQEVLQSDKPVLIDYWAEWCGPCKMIAPVLAELADEYADKVQIAKLNIDDNPATPPKYGIRGIPTLMLFKNGEVEATKVGAVSKAQLAAFLDENIWAQTSPCELAAAHQGVRPGLDLAGILMITLTLGWEPTPSVPLYFQKFPSI